MEFRVLKYFLKVAQEGSMTAAANKLYLTQPTLSRQMKNLEEELGKKLFVRSNYNVKLTEDGRLLRQRAELIIEMVDKTTEEFKTANDSISGNVYIGAAQANSVQSAIQVMKELQNIYPGISYHLFDGNFDDITAKLDRGILDFGIVAQPVNLTKYNHLELPDKNLWGVIMKKDSKLAQKSTVTVDDLINVSLICSRQALQYLKNSNEFSNWFGEKFNKLHIVATFNLVYNASLMVKAGMGYLIAFDNLVDTSNSSELCFRPLTPKLESRLHLIWKKDQLFSTPAKTLLDRFEASLKS